MRGAFLFLTRKGDKSLDRGECNLGAVTGRTFIEEEDYEVRDEAPLPVRKGAMTETGVVSGLLPYGTEISEAWTEEWTARVAELEKRKGQAICGSRLRETEVDQLVRSETITPEQADTDPLAVVCVYKAGRETAHPGVGRCFRHGGNDTDPRNKFSMVAHESLSPKIKEFLDLDELTDLRGAIAGVWAAADALVGPDGDLDGSRATDFASMMTRIGNLTKQHSDITEKRKITIEVPEFIAWADFFYELAVRYIMDGQKDVQGFLQEAKGYYDATVTLKVGLTEPGNSDPTVDSFSGDQAAEVLRSGESES